MTTKNLSYSQVAPSTSDQVSRRANEHASCLSCFGGEFESLQHGRHAHLDSETDATPSLQAGPCAVCGGTPHWAMCPRDNSRVTYPTSEPKLYAVTRRDLPWSTRIVQAGHAIAMAASGATNFKSISPHGPAFVLYGVLDERELRNLYDRVAPHGAVGFWEPDLGDQLTALAHLSTSSELFEGLRLL